MTIPNEHQPGTESGDQADDAVIGRAFRRSLVIIAVVLVVVAAIAFSLRPRREIVEPRTTPLESAAVRQEVSVTIPRVAFTDVTEAAGIDFVHVNGAYGQKLLPETMGGGCAFFDYDNDGDPDLLLVNSCYWPGQQPDGAEPPTMALYANDGHGHFVDVTAEAGLDVTFYGMGVAVGDYDNDGWRDVFISAVGKDRLFRNEQGKFVDVTDSANVGGDETAWSTSCGFFDYNNDGRLDLFVCHYVKWSAELDASLERTLDGVNRAYLPPASFEGTFPSLYRNEGDGRFSEVSAEAGLHVKNPATGVPMAKSLGLAFMDFDRDGWTDVVVANDTVQNFLFHNQRGSSFREIGATAGIAFDINGQARGAMGIDAGQFRNNQDVGLVIGNFSNEMSALYVTQGEALSFSDEAIASGLGPETRLELTFGMFFFDFDLDSRLDVFAANGHLEDDIRKIQESQSYEQPPQLFWNAGIDQTTEFPAVPDDHVGADFCRPLVGRGATYADIDGDGDLDVLITASGGRPRLLRNDQATGHHWLRIKLSSAGNNRDALGAFVEVQVGDKTLARYVSPTRSYLSQSELPLTFGLGTNDEIDGVTISWPDGTKQTIQRLDVDQLHVIEQPTSADDAPPGTKPANAAES